MRVLLAEDDRISRKMATVALEGAGYEVDAVGDGEEAWERLLADPERLLVTDWMMPNMDGVELTRRVRAGTFSSYVYVILVTALADPKSAIEGLEAGADDHLGKPYDPRELIARVNVGTRVQQLERGLRESRRQLRELVTLDPTTGLLNRASIERRAHEEAARALDAGSPLSLALVAVEGLEGVLRAHGRSVADELVRRIAASIEDGLRPYDAAGRWAGEEVVAGIRWGSDQLLLVLPGRDPEEASRELETLLAAIEASTAAGGDTETRAPSLSAGVGGAVAGVPIDIDGLVADAMSALAAASAKGDSGARVGRSAA